MSKNRIRSFIICHLPFAIRPFSILLFLLLWAHPVGAQGGDPPTPALTPAPTLTLTPLPKPLRPDVEPFDGSLILENPLLWGLARRMLAGLGVANIRDYLAVVFALMGIARLIARPQAGTE